MTSPAAHRDVPWKAPYWQRPLTGRPLLIRRADRHRVVAIGRDDGRTRLRSLANGRRWWVGRDTLRRKYRRLTIVVAHPTGGVL